MELPSLPPWWDVLNSWKLIDSSTAKVAARAQALQGDEANRKLLLRELLSAYPYSPEGAHEIYGKAIQQARSPVMVHTGTDTVRGPMQAGCLTYQSVVVADPIWAIKLFWQLTQDGLIGRSNSEDEAVSVWSLMLTEVVSKWLSQLLPLIREGVVLLDAGMGPHEIASDLWSRLGKRTAATLHERFVFEEVVWATYRARSVGGTVGTIDLEFADILKTVGRGVEGSDIVQAVEVPILLPFVQDLTGDEILTLRRRHEDSLAQFRAAFHSLTTALRSVSPGDLDEGRARQAANDYLEGELAKLRREWSAVKVFRYGTAASAGISLVTAVLGVVTGAPAGVGSVVPIATGTAALAGTVSSLAMDMVRMKGNNLYVLWQASRLPARTRGSQ